MANNETMNPRIVVIGGGTGSSTLLKDLKDFTPNITALVSMSDDGSSTGRLREDHGVLPPGDLRQCLAALSEVPEVRSMFEYRFGEGSLKGHSLGNIILAGLELQHRDLRQAVKVASSILQITGQVIPITLDEHTLVMDDGPKRIRGQYVIGNRKIQSPDAHLQLDPEAKINEDAVEVIEKADLAVIAPGNLYGSLLPALIVRGVAEALSESQARKIMVTNLVTKPGQTDGWHVVDYVHVVEKYVGEGSIDGVLYNTALPSKDLLSRYAAEGEFPIGITPARFEEIATTFFGADLLAESVFVQDSSDTTPRTLIRHDGKRVGEELMKIYHS